MTQDPPDPTVLEVAAVQLNSRDDLEQNLRTCRELVRQASHRGAKLVLLPENFAFFSADAGRRHVAESLAGEPGPIRQAMSEWAREHAITLIGGGFPEIGPDPLRPYNTCAVVGPSGDLVASYRKLHLFDVDLSDGTRLRESEATAAGDTAQVVEVAGFKVGLSICYDLRFPELYRALADQGAEVLVVPAAFTLHTGKDHWHVLLRARAIEAQAWVVAAGQWGRHPRDRVTYGHSLVVDPWGTVVAEASDGVGLVRARVERARLDEVRRGLPSLRHRRL
ncbi:MAG TPA: carbon-nitrogen hydrolase family protein [Polyangiaceae bacterium]